MQWMVQKQFMSKKVISRRHLDGVLLLDKALGVSSNAALQTVKHLFRAKKAGHTGSLDPLATGMLPICFGRATRFCQYLLEADKSYLVGFKLGVKTTTGDSEGDIVSRSTPPASLSMQQLEQFVAPFRGEIWQVPSMYSALKHQGRPLYEYARQGITIEREPRKLFISELSLLRFENDDVFCKVSCSKGTYIRSLVEDIGDAIGCGAHVTELRRLTVANFDTRNMHPVELFQAELNQEESKLDDFVMPIGSMLSHLPSLSIDIRDAKKLKQGGCLNLSESQSCAHLALYSLDGLFYGVAERVEETDSFKMKTWSSKPG